MGTPRSGNERAAPSNDAGDAPAAALPLILRAAPFRERPRRPEQGVALAVLPDVAHQDAARAHQALGDIEGAVVHLRLAARTGPASRRPFHWWTLGSLFYLAHRYDDAISALSRAARWGTTDRPSTWPTSPSFGVNGATSFPIWPSCSKDSKQPRRARATDASYSVNWRTSMERGQGSPVPGGIHHPQRVRASGLGHLAGPEIARAKETLAHVRQG